MRYIETTTDTVHKGQHVDKGTFMAFEDDDPALGNYLAAKRAREVDEEAFKASQRGRLSAPAGGSGS